MLNNHFLVDSKLFSKLGLRKSYHGPMKQKNTYQAISFIQWEKKETQALVFSCEFCEIFKNTFFTEHLWATVSEGSIYLKRLFYVSLF